MKKTKGEKGSASTKVIIIIIIAIIIASLIGVVFFLSKKGIIGTQKNVQGKDGYASIDTSKNTDYLKFVDKKDDEYIYLDKNGNKVVVTDFYGTGRDIAYGVYPSRKENGYVLINLDGKTIVENGKYSSYINIDYDISNYASKYFQVSDSKSNKGIIDCTGKVIVPVQYKSVLEQFAETDAAEETEDGIYFEATLEDTNTATKKIEYYSPSGKKFFEYSKASNGGNVYTEEAILLENKIAIVSFTNNETKKVTVCNATTGELIVEHDAIPVEQSDGTQKLLNSRIERGQCTLLDIIPVSRTEDRQDVYFFGQDKNVTNKISVKAYDYRYVFEATSKKYYVFDPKYISDVKKYQLYDMYGKKIHEFDNSIKINKDANSDKYYFVENGKIYDEQFKIVAEDVKTVGGAHYFKDNTVYTMDGEVVMKDVSSLETYTDKSWLSGVIDGTSFDIAMDDSKNSYIIKDKTTFKLPQGYTNLHFVDNNRRYFWYSDGKDTHIIDSNLLKEVGKFDDTKPTTLSVNAQCNLIKKSGEYNKYYNFKGDLIYEVKK